MILRLTLAFSSYSFFLMLLLFLQDWESLVINPYMSIVIKGSALFFCLLTSWIVLNLSKRSHSNRQRFKLVKPAEPQALPVYIGLFMIAFSLPDFSYMAQTCLSILLFVVWMCLERDSYFNVFWLAFGYRYYEASTSNDEIVTLITKRQELKGNQDLENLARINNFTFLEVKD